jgi:hypothetical protein
LPKQVELPEFHERRYTWGGRVAHVLWVGRTMQPYAAALCGRQPQLFDAWRGSGSQDEEDKAAAMPLCRICAEVLAARAFLREVWGVGRFAPRDVPHKPQEGRCIVDGQPWPCKTRMKELRASTRA